MAPSGEGDEPPMRILGIDPGLQITGYGVVDYQTHKPRLVDGGVVRLSAKSPLADRLVELETELRALIDEHKPEICAVEQLYSHYSHPRTAILMGHARGVILLVGQNAACALSNSPPTASSSLSPGRGMRASCRCSVPSSPCGILMSCLSRRTWPMRWRLRSAADHKSMRIPNNQRRKSRFN